jgi:hypothetical protein
VSDIQAPVDEKQTTRYRVARLLVIILSALIILAVVALVVGGALQMTGHSTKIFGSSKPAPAPVGAEVFVLPPGAKVVKTETQPGRLILHVHSAAGDEIDIVDTADGHLISRIGPMPSP